MCRLLLLPIKTKLLMHENLQKELEKIYIIQPITRENEEKYTVLHAEAISLIESAGAVYVGTI